ncbi:dual specificity serine/threonine and tyrosine phosphatase [Bodo saltans virus]|uniref:Dual specificity serine/threonine and tyrosine phosphatase n=1 Tax=Bodo saltans virus TaxID=2024608 RepID=A0A2H4UUE0_9VIRU|nr:dual specificity serine/threonine and tyrosine phosphatase [Bodo saltans virus]ATZ80467.1 dual specificity serine/threonine and tyrosine phosphatase [Bodo saltans virus]
MFTKSNGCLFLEIDNKIISQYIRNTNIPEIWKKKQQERDNNRYHITIITSLEIDNIETIKDNPDNINFEVIGLKMMNDIAFLVVHYPSGDVYRKKLGLKNKDFHITVGFANKDNHNIDKSIKCLTKEDITNFSFFNNKTLISKQHEIMLHMYTHFPNNIEVLKKYAEILFAIKLYDHSMSICYEIMNFNLEDGILSLLRIMIHIGRIDKTIVIELADKLNGIVAGERKNDIIIIMNKYLEKNYLCIREGKYNKIKKPKNFSKIVENLELYGSAIIKLEHIDFLNDIGITAIVNLMEKTEESIDFKLTSQYGKKYFNFEIKDRSIPSQKQMIEILDIISDLILNGEKVVVHCMGGKGRTNMILACYLMKEHGLKYGEIMESMYMIREIAFSDEQTMLMKNFDCKRSQKNIKFNGKNSPKMIIMVGLPASGKSTLSNHLCEYVDNVVRANQDELGKQDVFKIISDNMLNKSIVIVDRCNITAVERKEFLSYLKMNQKALAILFNIPIDECIYRAQKRENHPTLKPESAERIISEISEKIEPIVNENFDNIITISSSDDLNFILKSWNLPEIHIEYDMDLMKFPRTHHLCNLGSATREDLILSQTEQNDFLNVDIVIEEKIDGANFGISIDPDVYKIIYQNRSHYVTPQQKT